MQSVFFLCFGWISLVMAQCDNPTLTEHDCDLLKPDCYFNYNTQLCDFEYSSGMDKEMCAHGFPGSYWNGEACVTDPCIYWTVFDSTDGITCNETLCQWRQYHNVKFGAYGNTTFVESYQCVRNSLERDNPCYMLGPAIFTPPNEYYCEHFDECEITVIYDSVQGYSYENCDLKEDEDCDDVGVDQCSDESPTCFVSGGKCVLDTCLRESGACPSGCVEKPFHDMTLVYENAYYSEITQCVNSSVAEEYNQCYLIKPSYCDHYDDCEEKVAAHGSHSHLICGAKKTSGTSVMSVSAVIRTMLAVVVIVMEALNL